MFSLCFAFLIISICRIDSKQVLSRLDTVHRVNRCSLPDLCVEVVALSATATRNVKSSTGKSTASIAAVAKPSQVLKIAVARKQWVVPKEKQRDAKLAATPLKFSLAHSKNSFR